MSVTRDQTREWRKDGWKFRVKVMKTNEFRFTKLTVLLLPLVIQFQLLLCSGLRARKKQQMKTEKQPIPYR